MSEFTPEQLRVIKRLDRALKDANKLDLAVRVFDGSVLMCTNGALTDPRYGEFGPDGSSWMKDRTVQIGGEINADGGAGS